MYVYMYLYVWICMYMNGYAHWQSARHYGHLSQYLNRMCSLAVECVLLL